MRSHFHLFGSSLKASQCHMCVSVAPSTFLHTGDLGERLSSGGMGALQKWNIWEVVTAGSAECVWWGVVTLKETDISRCSVSATAKIERTRTQLKKA